MKNIYKLGFQARKGFSQKKSSCYPNNLYVKFFPKYFLQYKGKLPCFLYRQRYIDRQIEMFFD